MNQKLLEYIDFHSLNGILALCVMRTTFCFRKNLKCEKSVTLYNKVLLGNAS